jgi:hypothetical protein
VITGNFALTAAVLSVSMLTAAAIVFAFAFAPDSVNSSPRPW